MLRLGSISLLLALSLPLAAQADEGMWMPQQIPMLGEELQEMGLELDPNSFADLTAFPMGAIVSLGGCSAAFVSDQGLIVTNHHCVYGSLAYNSTPENDLIVDGFLAKDMSEEPLASPTARVYVTSDIEDVTAEVIAGLGPEVSDYDRAELIDQRRKEMVEACEEPGDVRCWVRGFFGGEMFLKLTALVLKDVRLVYAPANGVGSFGGEVDNWMWPRHTGDFGFYRAYIGPDGKPAEYSPDNVPFNPEHHLEVSTRDLDPEDLVLLAGYPGRTSRLVTAQEVRQAQEYSMPTGVKLREQLGGILRAQGEGYREVQLANASRIRGLDNYRKKNTGVLESFERNNLLAQKLESERQLHEHYGDNPERGAEIEAIHEEFNEILTTNAATRERDTVFRRLNTASPMLTQARSLHRLSVERAKPDEDREEGYQERDWERRAAFLRRAQRSIEPGSDRAGLQWILEKAIELPADQRIDAIDTALAATGEANQEQAITVLLDQLYAGTSVGDLEARQEMFEQSTQELLSREDPFLDLADLLWPLGKELEDRAQSARGAGYRLRPQLIAAERDMRDGRLAPDANGTLRVGFGQVVGYRARDAVWYDPQTTVRGVLEKTTGEDPFDTPARLVELATAEQFGPYIDPDLGTLPVAFLSTVNVTNGSSGSSALNGHGEIIGLAFDMNWEGVAADWVVDESVVRTINVDSRYMLWVMDAVDGAHNVLREMGLPVHFGGDAGSGASLQPSP